MNDFEVLEKIINRELEIKELDNDTKIRLTILCDNRNKEIEEKLKIQKRKNKDLKLQLDNLMKENN